MQQLQQIFETLQSSCKNPNPNQSLNKEQGNQLPQYQQQQQTSEMNKSACSQHILQTILNNLEILGRKKQYQQGVMIIKNIIQSMDRNLSMHANIDAFSKINMNSTANIDEMHPRKNNLKIDTISNHVDGGMNYIVQTPLGDQDITLFLDDKSHFRTCIQDQEQKREQEEHFKGSFYPNKLAVTGKIDWDHIKTNQRVNNDHLDILDTNKQQQKPKIKYTVHKPTNHNYRHEDGSIFQCQQQQQQQQQQQYAKQTKRQPLEDLPNYEQQYDQQHKYDNNSMQSEQIGNTDTDNNLPQIDEQEQEQSLSVLPDQTIQFKKIIYMLDSGSTNKKLQPSLTHNLTHNYNHQQANNMLKQRHRTNSCQFKQDTCYGKQLYQQVKASVSDTSIRSLFSDDPENSYENITKYDRIRTQVSLDSPQLNNTSAIMPVMNEQETIKLKCKDQQQPMHKKVHKRIVSSSYLSSKTANLQKTEPLRSSKLKCYTPLHIEQQYDKITQNHRKSSSKNPASISNNSKNSNNSKSIKKNAMAQNEKNDPKMDKSKQLNDIVNMLSSKYNRTVKLSKH